MNENMETALCTSMSSQSSFARLNVVLPSLDLYSNTPVTCDMSPDPAPLGTRMWGEFTVETLNCLHLQLQPAGQSLSVARLHQKARER